MGMLTIAREELGTPEGTRTPGLLLRRQLLYPAELLAQIYGAGDGNRTRIPSLEGWCPDHCATPAFALRGNCQLVYSSITANICQYLFTYFFFCTARQTLETASLRPLLPSLPSFLAYVPDATERPISAVPHAPPPLRFHPQTTAQRAGRSPIVPPPDGAHC